MFERLLAWLWDRKGEQRAAQRARMERARVARLHLRQAERRALYQIERTNVFVAEHQKGRV